MSTPLIALMAAPFQPKKYVASNISSHSTSTSNGSRPSRISFSPRAFTCDVGASTMVSTTAGDESASSIPVIPSSVSTSMIAASWVPSPITSTPVVGSVWAVTSVIFISQSMMAPR
jgi:hypothetical protein